MKLREASGLILWYMRLCGFKGWVSFWETIYVAPGHLTDCRLVRHELCHLDQIRREGRLRFAIGYLWKLVRHGCWNNKYEVAARAAERNP